MTKDQFSTHRHDCVFDVMYKCSGEACATCKDYETYKDWDQEDFLVSEMRDIL